MIRNNISHRLQKLVKANMLAMIAGLLLLPVIQELQAQSANMEYDRVKVADAKHMLCGLDLAPDHAYLAVSSTQSFPFYKFDYENRKVIEQYDVGNWYAGSRVEHSPDGKYILLQQLFYIDFSVNKDREVNYEILDAATGRRVKKFEKYHSVAFTPDSKYAVTLTANEVAFWELPSGNKVRSFKVPMASNGLAISPDGKTIAVSHHTDKKEMKKDPRFKKNKKARKAAIKYKQQISFYDLETFKRKQTIRSLYDIVYRLEYSSDGKTLFCMQIPHMKAQASGAIRQTYITTIDPQKGEALRKGFTSQAPYEPDFKLSPDGRLFGIVSRGTRFLELHIYDFESGRMLERFEQSYRLFEKTEGGMTMADSRISFVFLPDNQTVVMTMGNHLIYWKLNL